MPIEQKTPREQVASYLDSRLERARQVLIRNLMYVGEQVRNEAVSNGSYKDQTGHLRGSVGYVLTEDGRVIQAGGFGAPASPAEAKAEGRDFAESLAGRFPKGIALIVVAGKNYAGYVSAKGYNVLDKSEDLARELVPKMLKKLQGK